ncbi:dihydrodipicolinate synthase family protein [Pseudomonas oryzihabitans]|uniref:Dihydrodipicolinate synthase family protein n=1 Tax=Pseudomonas oryzihabitans TaxID=47885 RepID=A0A2Z5AC45_9PSED|nr:dihydrodipicolinate synthase family protein [Pseudomonas oryzihabitans]AXA66840.1 dihydrodipicolinate synthase family protein [Pseudomonas oryzihabitans]
MNMHGILPALVTPFDQAGHVDCATLASIVEYQLKAGVSGFVALGSTGEYYALDNPERRLVLQTVREVADGKGTLIANCNGASTREVIAQIRQAIECGFSNILLAPPFYALPTQEELINHYQVVLDTFADINVILYNYPIRTNVEVGTSVLAAFRDHPRVIGIKESSGNLLRAIEITETFKGGYQLSCGSDDQALDFFLWGATSWICGPANCFPDHIVAFHKAFTAGDIPGAQAVMRSLFPVMASMEQGKFIQKVKYGCELAGFNSGNARLPLLPLSDAEKADFRAVFEASQR